MNRTQMRQYIFMLLILIILTSMAVIGMLAIFRAADQARQSVKVTQCQNIVLGEAIHKFHISIALLEGSEEDKVAEKRLIREIVNEPDIAFAMKACKNK